MGIDYCADAVCGSEARYSGASAPPSRATDSRAHVRLVGPAVPGLTTPWKYIVSIAAVAAVAAVAAIAAVATSTAVISVQS